MEKSRVGGHAPLARWIVNEGARRGLALSYLREMQFDDGISVPTRSLTPAARFRLVPVTMNCTVPPIPTPERAYQVGSRLRDILAAYPGNERIAVIATGGLSPEPGGARFFGGGGGCRPRVPGPPEAGRSRRAASRVHARAHGGGGLGRHRRAAGVGACPRLHPRPRQRARLHAGGGVAIGDGHGGVERDGLTVEV